MWVTLREVQRIASLLGASVAYMTRRYTRTIGRRRSLRGVRSGACVFYDVATKGCRIHDEKPRQCRSFPFWPSNLRDEESWLVAGKSCEGVGVGELIGEDEITRRLRTIRV